MNKNIDKLFIFSDGASRGNPGHSSVGVVLFDENNNIIKEISKYIGYATNNVAEYLAVIYGLQEALYLKAKQITLYLDSQLVSKQLKKEYKVKDQNIRLFYGVASNFLKYFSLIDIKEIPRAKNKHADMLANKALDMI